MQTNPIVVLLIVLGACTNQPATELSRGSALSPSDAGDAEVGADARADSGGADSGGADPGAGDAGADASCSCPSDDNPCTRDECVDDVCEHTALDGEACTDDHNECTTDVCEGTSCQHNPNSGAACTDDGDTCTRDLCELDTCTHPFQDYRWCGTACDEYPDCYCVPTQGCVGYIPCSLPYPGGPRPGGFICPGDPDYPEPPGDVL